QQRTSLAPGSVLKTRTRFMPQRPQPTTPTRTMNPPPGSPLNRSAERTLHRVGSAPRTGSSQPDRPSAHEPPQPPLQAEQRPDQQPVILVPGAVFVEDARDVAGLQEVVHARLAVAQQAVEVVDALAAEPAGVGGAEPLLGAVGELRRHDPFHRPA